MNTNHLSASAAVQCTHLVCKQTLDEYIQDTEDLVNTSLDQKRNELISCDVLLTSNIVALGLMSTISSIFAMNMVPASLMVRSCILGACLHALRGLTG